ncbi:hypothetical protein MKZ38_001728 [Zalerion maritima]|uniref:Putative phospholipase n=1 Tax=Zalerion maritima TaxID=339359 RepID=A0AAD5RPU9_9PEZI|nr:hypothetical protein MKZ38_001728 [Zalerion maritima]
MMSYLSRLTPVPSFPSYTGPYTVGTIDVEIPISDLQSPAPAPENADHIQTIQFRIFYPAAQTTTGKKIPWLPNPQRAHLVGYTKFLGLGPMMAEIVSFIPRHLHYTNIPALKNVALYQSSPYNPSPASDSESTAAEESDSRWPTMIFSHGLGGSRNSYSHIAGSVASHGVVVICPEHRDGSSILSFIRDPEATPSYFSRRSSGRTVVPYRRISHDETPEVWAERDSMLRVRCWEMGLLHNAILALDRGQPLTNLNTSTPAKSTQQFRGALDVQRPGSLIFAGHSFGSTTMVQFLKSIFYHAHPTIKSMAHPLYKPSPSSELVQHVTAKTVTVLLDMWCFPLVSPSTPELFTLPLPAYTSTPDCPAPGGSAILAIESEGFYKWTEHLHTMARVISPKPASKVVSPAHFETDDGVKLAEPNFFYVGKSAHMSQSDFCVLFPWFTKKAFGAESPERALRLNQRAIVQMFRSNGISVGGTWVGDMVEDGDKVEGKLPVIEGERKEGEEERATVGDDPAILERSKDGPVEYWHWIDVIGMGSASHAGTNSASNSEMTLTGSGDGEHEMEGEIEPHLASSEGGKAV